jgi:hypothetical protein
MKKAGNGFIKTLPYLCLVGVIALGLMTIVGTGGGGGNGSTTDVSGFSSDPMDVVPTTQVNESTPEKFSATIEIPGIAGNPIVVDGDTYYKITVSGAGFTGEVGKPEIPFILMYLLIPEDKETGVSLDPEVSVTPSGMVTIKDVSVYPAQPPMADRPVNEVLDMPSPEFEKDDAAYSQTGPYPEKTVETEVMRVGPMSVLVVRIYPVKFMPADEVLQFYRNIDVDIDFNPDEKEAKTFHHITEIDEEGIIRSPFKPSLLGLVLNSDTAEETVVTWIPPEAMGAPQPHFDDPLYQILIVSNPDFMGAAYMLAEHKCELDWRVKVTGTDEIEYQYGDLTSQSLREYVRSEWRGNGDFCYMTDGDEPDVANNEDMKYARIYKKTKAGSVNLALRMLFYDEPDVYKIVVYFDTDGDGSADLQLVSDQPYDNFYVYEEESPGSFTILKAQGFPRILSNRLILFEFPWEDAFETSALDLWFVTRNLTGIADTMPNEGSVHVDINDYMPSLRYLILIGDAEHIPVTYSLNEGLAVTTPTKRVLKVGTDHYYADLGNNIFPEIAVGRLSVDEPEQAENIVAKIEYHETNNPFNIFTPYVTTLGQFQDEPTVREAVTGQVTWSLNRVTGPADLWDVIESVDLEKSWQSRWIQIEYIESDETKHTPWLKVTSRVNDSEIVVSGSNTGSPIQGDAKIGVPDGQADRPFIDTAEKVGNFFYSRGHYVGRHYRANTDVSHPEKFCDGRYLPGRLTIPAYDWTMVDGSFVRDHVFDAYNNLLILHRDHGGIDGWGTPGFGVSFVNGLHPGIGIYPLVYPVVLSINCSTAYFDNETDYFLYHDGTTEPNNVWWSEVEDINFSEALIRHEGGAVTVIAPSRLSYSGKNDIFVDGLIGAMYPDYFGSGVEPGSASIPLGELFLYAKMYTYPRIEPEWADYYMEIFHVIGDPSLKVWRHSEL